MSSTEEKERFDQARATSHRRAKQFVDAVTPEMNALDDRIEAELARDNASLRSKLGKVYKLVDAASALASPHVACKRGCSACCHMNVSITLVEAERLSAVSGRRLKAVTAPVTHDEAKFSGTPCPFLLNDECSVYQARPFACRAHRSFDVDNYWCQPERSFQGGMGIASMAGAEAAYIAIANATKLQGFADIRDFFPPESAKLVAGAPLRCW